jgi:hypothetical protein
VSADGEVAPDLVLVSTEDVLDLLVALLHPHPQPVEPRHLGHARRGVLAFGFPLGAIVRGGQTFGSATRAALTHKPTFLKAERTGGGIDLFSNISTILRVSDESSMNVVVMSRK